MQNLTVAYSQNAPILRDVSFKLNPGEVLAVTGTSGSGKTTLGRAILQVLPADCTRTGSILWDGLDLTKQSTPTLRKLRGNVICCMPQQPAIALHPLIPVGFQVEDVLKSHGKYSSRSRTEAIQLFNRFGLSDKCFLKYPHQLSGGQLQRAAMVQSVICRPQLLIADEPFAAQDTVTRREIIDLFRLIRESFTLSILLISHDRQVVSAFADRVARLENGSVT